MWKPQDPNTSGNAIDISIVLDEDKALGADQEEEMIFDSLEDFRKYLYDEE